MSEAVQIELPYRERSIPIRSSGGGLLHHVMLSENPCKADADSEKISSRDMLHPAMLIDCTK
jgi:hypothetical protein